jgi:hypothetical protein
VKIRLISTKEVHFTCDISRRRRIAVVSYTRIAFLSFDCVINGIRVTLSYMLHSLSVDVLLELL